MESPLEWIPYFHFNISQSGNWVVCATDNHPVGIDIEQIQPIDFQIVNSYFSKKEIQDFRE
jgi:4'-phosphopantetheinyl transferase